MKNQLIIFIVVIAGIACNSIKKDKNWKKTEESQTYISDKGECAFTTLSFENDSAGRYYCQATKFIKSGKYKEALFSANIAKKMEPNNKMLLKDIALLHTIMNQYDSAKYYLNMALKIDNEYSLAFNQLSAVYLKQDSIQKALSASNKAISLRPNYNPFIVNKILALEKLNQTDSCCLYLKKLKENDTHGSYGRFKKRFAKLDCK